MKTHALAKRFWILLPEVKYWWLVMWPHLKLHIKTDLISLILSVGCYRLLHVSSASGGKRAAEHMQHNLLNLYLLLSMVVPWALVTLWLVNGVTKLLAGAVMRVEINRGVHIGQHFRWDKTSSISSLFIIYSNKIFCPCTLQWTLYVFSVQGKKEA